MCTLWALDQKTFSHTVCSISILINSMVILSRYMNTIVTEKNRHEVVEKIQALRNILGIYRAELKTAENSRNQEPEHIEDLRTAIIKFSNEKFLLCCELENLNEVDGS